jgi:hypothetical protein
MKPSPFGETNNFNFSVTHEVPQLWKAIVHYHVHKSNTNLCAVTCIMSLPPNVSDIYFSIIPSMSKSA